jgi:hypothetical protein
MPKLQDKKYIASDDSLFDEILDLQNKLTLMIGDEERGCMQNFDKLLEKGGFKKAVMDHIIDKLNMDKDPLMACANTTVTTKLATVTSEGLRVNAVTKSLEQRDELKSRISPNSLSTNHIEQQRLFKRGQDLETSIGVHRKRLREIGYSIEGFGVVPTFDTDLLHGVVQSSQENWANCSEQAARCDHLFQKRLRAIIDFLSSSSNPTRLNKTLALITTFLDTKTDAWKLFAFYDC